MARLSGAGASLLPCVNYSLSSRSQPCFSCCCLLPSPQWHWGTTSLQNPQPTLARPCCPDPTPVQGAQDSQASFPYTPKWHPGGSPSLPPALLSCSWAGTCPVAPKARANVKAEPLCRATLQKHTPQRCLRSHFW